VAERLPLARRGGFGSVELFASAVVFLCAGAQPSLRAFFTRFSNAFPQIAGIVDRHTLPSSASVSRALSGLELDAVAALSDDLLARATGLDAVLRRLDVGYRDAHGKLWHGFDFDPSTRGFRQRDVVEGDEFPAPKRLAQGVPGHMGRKRGEIRQQDHLLQHAGSGLWAYYRLNSEGGSAAPYLEEAAGVARRWVDRIDHPADQTFIRTDGEFGHLASLAGCRAHGLHYLTRIARYHLFDRPEVVAALVTARWRPVPGMEHREAAELGNLMLHDSEGTHEPVRCRVVVTRIRTDRAEPSHGILRDGYQFETFATTLSTDAWPAEDVVWLYSGRSGIENGFAQHDRAYEIDRTFSYSPAGQQFFVMVALLLWNEHVCMGAATSPEPRVPRQPPRPPQAPEPETPPDIALPDPGAVTPNVAAPPAEAPPQSSAAADSGGTTAITSIRELMAEAVEGRTLLRGWTMKGDTGVLICPAGNTLHAFHAEVATVKDGRKIGQNRVTMRTLVGACDGCRFRPTCFASSKQNTYKTVAWAVPTGLAARFREALHAARREPRVRPPRRRSATEPPVAEPRTDRPLFEAVTRPLPPGRFMPQSPFFSPGLTHSRTAAALRDVEVDVRLTKRRRRPPKTPESRNTSRASRRRSWAERQKLALTPFLVEVTIVAKRSARALLDFNEK
jgi:hypothetical protein